MFKTLLARVRQGYRAAPRTGAEKQQPLEDAVVQHVQETRGEPDKGERRYSLGQAEHADTNPSGQN
jgi:hypothetical protein